MTDSIADMLTRIRNAQAVGKQTVEVPFSRMRYAIAKILEQGKFIASVELKGRKNKRSIEMGLRYEQGVSGIQGLRRVSRPGQRMYMAARSVKRVKGGRGIAIFSTSRGLMTDADARRKNVGGEMLCEIW